MSTDLSRLIRTIPDFPSAGIQFRDITPLLADAVAYRRTIVALAAPFRDAGVDQVVAIEARGYLLGAPLAVALGAGFVPVRKVGKLPYRTYRAEYALEYGEAAIEMHEDALLASHRVLVVDDVLATGGTLNAALALVERAGAHVAGIAVLIELDALGGRAALGGRDVHALLHY
ncbi:MAG: adenine phosphoribosyltransferase [Chloroflexota bacterium]